MKNCGRRRQAPLRVYAPKQVKERGHAAGAAALIQPARPHTHRAALLGRSAACCRLRCRLRLGAACWGKLLFIGGWPACAWGQEGRNALFIWASPGAEQQRAGGGGSEAKSPQGAAPATFSCVQCKHIPPAPPPQRQGRQGKTPSPPRPPTCRRAARRALLLLGVRLDQLFQLLVVEAHGLRHGRLILKRFEQVACVEGGREQRHAGAWKWRAAAAGGGVRAEPARRRGRCAATTLLLG